MHFISCWLLLLFWYTLKVRWVNAEVYTAIVDMENLLKTEFVLMETLQNYIQQQEQKLSLLKKQVALYSMEYEKAQADPTEYLANPINAYLLVKRLTTDWKNTENLLKNNFYEEMTNNLTESDSIEFPTNEDLSGAAVALTRLQDTYNLDTQSIARGELNGVKYSTELTTDDCFELGRQSYFNEDYYHTVLWMREALRKYDLEQNNTNTQKWEILEYLAYSIYMQGNVAVAFKLTEELLSIFPDHVAAKGNLEYYRNIIKSKEEEEEKKKGDDGDLEMIDDDGEAKIRGSASETLTLTERTKYEMLCRKEIELPISISSKLKCRYVNKGKPYLLLAPLKEEEAFLDPRIVLYRQIISDAEIEIIKSLAKPRLKRATVQNQKTGELEVAHYRISKSAWLKDSEHPVIATVRRRIEDITSLTVETAEELQVVNYGIGGHYEPHYDFARKDEVNAFKSLGTGNRIATALFYMSEVKQGGATVFPPLNLALWPEKGSAAFWHNLHSSGVGNERTRHAACPVLTGSKWVSNVWLHERGQEFLRPCDPNDMNRDFS